MKSIRLWLFTFLLGIVSFPILAQNDGVSISLAVGQPTPITTTTVIIDVAFEEAVNDFVASSVVFTGSTMPGDLSATITDGVDGDQNFEVTVTIAAGVGNIQMQIAAGAATLDSDPGISTTASNTLNIAYNLAPQVTVTAAAGQDNPTNASPIDFTAVFSKPVEDFDDATDIALSAVGGPLSATVMEIAPMDGTTYNIAVTGMSGQGNVSIQIEAGAGNSLETGTPSAVSNTEIVVFDEVSPTITTLTPANAATNQERIINFSATFNEDIVAGTGAIELREYVGDALVESFPAGIITITGGNIIEFTNTVQLDYNTQYYIVIPTGAFEDIAGNAFGGLTDMDDWEFTVKGDNDPPVIVSLDPPNGATNIQVTVGTITITFDEPVALATGSTGGPDLRQIRIRRGVTNEQTLERADFGSYGTITNNVVEINIAALQLGGTVYSVTIGDNFFTDLPGNDFIGTNRAVAPTNPWQFTTELPPNISGFFPANTCVGELVTINGTNFSATPTVDILETDGSTLVLSIVDYITQNTNQVRFNVPVGLSAGTYKLRVNKSTGLSVVSGTNLTISPRPLTNLTINPTSTTAILDSNEDITVTGPEANTTYQLIDVTTGSTIVDTENVGGSPPASIILNTGILDVEQLYTFRIRATKNLIGCPTFLDDDITINVVAVEIDAGDDRTVCTGEPTTLGGNPTVTGGNFISLAWSVDPTSAVAGGIPNNVTNPVVSFSESATVTLTYEDSDGLILMDEVVVTVNEALDPDLITITANPNENAFSYNIDEGPIQLGYTVGAPGYTDNNFTIADFTGPGVTNNIFYPNASGGQGNKTITLNLTDLNGCEIQQSESFLVRDPAGLVTTLPANLNYCEDANPALLNLNKPVNNIDGTPFTLNLRQNTNIIETITTDINDQFNFNPGAYNTGLNYNFHLTYRGEVATIGNTPPAGLNCNTPHINYYELPWFFGVLQVFVWNCEQTQSSPAFSISPLPIITIDNVRPEGYCVNGENFIVNVDPTGGTWEPRPFLTPGFGGALINPSEANIGNNTITYEFTDVRGCFNSESANILVNNIPNIQIEDTFGCVEDDILFTPNMQIPPNVTVNKITWDFGDNTVVSPMINEEGPQIYSTTITNDYTNISPGIGYPVTLTAWTTNGCMEVSPTRNVLIGNFPDIDFSWQNVCEGDQLTMFPTSDIPAGTDIQQIQEVHWDFGNGTESEPDNFDPQTPVYDPDATYLVTLSMTSGLGCQKIIQKEVYKVPQITVTGTNPYFETFDSGTGNWITSSASINNSWDHGTPAGINLFGDASDEGTGQAWVTNLTGQYEPEEKSFIHSPCFDLSNLPRPVLGFDYWLLTQPLFDGAVIQIASGDSEDNPDEEAANWINVGAIGEGINWFNSSGILGKPGGQEIGQIGWSGNGGEEWKRALIALDDHLAGINLQKVRFRIAFGSQVSIPDVESFDGFAVDNFEINQRERIVLLEHFNNATTTTGLAGMNAANTFISAPKTVEEVIKIQYHIGIPEKDQIFRDNPVDPGARSSYYGISQIPESFLDGVGRPTDQTFAPWADATFSAQTLRPVPVRIDALNSFPPNNPGTNQMRVEVEFTPVSDLPPNTILHIALVEKGIDSDFIPGGNLGTYSFILKKMLPNAAGTKFTETLPAGVTQTVSFTWTPDVRFYDSDSLALVAFLQDESTREVLQSRANLNPTYIPNLEDVTTGTDYLREENISLYPNPATSFTRVQFDQTLKKNHNVVVYDTFGKQVWTGVMRSGTNSLDIETGHLSPGVYVITIDNQQDQSVKKKLMVLRK